VVGSLGKSKARRDRKRDQRKRKKGLGPRLEGEWRASKNGGWEGEFGGACKMEVCLEALLEMDFCIESPNFEVEVHM
jgi:hypothetical protein